MSDPDPTFNLTALSDRLFAEGRLLPLAGKIRRARDLHSLSTDLVMALEGLDALDVLFNSPSVSGDYIKTAMELALLNNALVLYVRATKTESQQRGGFDLLSRFNELEKVAHKELTDLRDHAIAHFGSGGSYVGEWQAELVILQVRGEDAKPAVVTRRQMVDQKLAKRTRKQIEVALALLRALALEKLSEVTDEINKAGADDPAFHNELRQHLLNLDIFLTSDEAGQAARSSFDQGGYVKGIVSRA